ncbi:MAG: hypothetical protein IJ191_03670 [Treponema sp.]|nr:hypothetical protein [Treponema sp.]
MSSPVRQTAKESTLWRENLEALPNEIFLHLMQLYLHEIKTPYNKSRLIEQLQGFLQQPNNQKILLRLSMNAIKR